MTEITDVFETTFAAHCLPHQVRNDLALTLAVEAVALHVLADPQRWCALLGVNTVIPDWTPNMVLEPGRVYKDADGAYHMSLLDAPAPYGPPRSLEERLLGGHGEGAE